MQEVVREFVEADKTDATVPAFAQLRNSIEVADQAIREIKERRGSG